MKTDSIPRIFIPHALFNSQQAASAFLKEIRLVSREQIHYLQSVLRLKSGNPLVIVDPALEVEYVATLAAITKQEAIIHLEGEVHTPHIFPSESDLPCITLAAALIKEARWDWLLQKVTELGVRNIQPLITERTVVEVKNLSHKLARWQGIAEAAAAQSEGLFIPVIQPPVLLADFLRAQAASKQTALKLFLLEREGCTALGESAYACKPMRTFLTETFNESNKKADISEVMGVIGPEGGWSAAEALAMVQSGFQPVSLGHRILRSETACVALISSLVYEWTC